MSVKLSCHEGLSSFNGTHILEQFYNLACLCRNTASIILLCRDIGAINLNIALQGKEYNRNL